MADTPNEMSLRSELVAAYQRVDALGLNGLSSGNLSLRFGANMLISPAGATGELAHGQAARGSGHGPSSGRETPATIDNIGPYNALANTICNNNKKEGPL